MILANSQGQALVTHLKACARLSELKADHYFNNSTLSQACYYAGLLHDIGKVDLGFQNFAKGKTQNLNFDKPLHNEVSLYLIMTFIEQLPLSSQGKKAVPYTALWHHAKAIRKKNPEKLNDLKPNKTVLKRAQTLLKELGLSVEPTSINKSDTLPKFRDYVTNDTFEEFIEDINNNNFNNIVRSVVILSDRIISSLSPEELNRRISEDDFGDLIVTSSPSSNLPNDIKACLQRFDDLYPDSLRNKVQNQASNKLRASGSIAILQGPAGCGKTKISLEWAKDANRVYWICPEQTICRGIYSDLKKDLPWGNFELIMGGESLRYNNGVETETDEKTTYQADIIITTIDQISKGIITHSGISVFNDFLNSHVVFDEFHKFARIPSYNLLFPELIQCKKMMGEKANTLLVSATPNYVFVEDFLGLHEANYDHVKVETFNTADFKFLFGQSEGLLSTSTSKGTIVISNTARTSQMATFENRDAINYHSKLVPSRRAELLDHIYDLFGNKDNINENHVIRSGPALETSINITCSRMLTEICNPESMIQRLGRLNRFSLDLLATFVICGTIDSPSGKFLSKINSYHSTKAWIKFFENQASEIMKLQNVYDIYNAFYEDKACRDAVRKDIIQSLNNGARIIDKALTPPLKFKKLVGDSNRLAKKSLRGDSRYIKVVRYDIDEGITNELVSEPITMSLSEIEGYDEDTNLINYQQKYHARSEMESINYGFVRDSAVSPDEPIRVSYLPEELEEVGLRRTKHAIYYCNEIGLIRIKDYPF